MLRHLEFRHLCGEGEEEQILSYEDYVRHCRFDCCQIREFSCLEPGCSEAEKKMSKTELEDHFSNGCEGMQVACLTCKVVLPGHQFAEHDCLENQIVAVRQLRAEAARLKESKTGL
mmetsp:Transcript_42304/g.64881  ORF Transcript_42304/g.64881 Transcript_42304/m.64881 type:complete len:116 (+) Transcript_42304:625-972(+)